jgi:hypothetical protein
VRHRNPDDPSGKPEKIIFKIQRNVEQRWAEWPAATVLERVFQSKIRVFQAICDAGGSNVAIPRSGHSHAGDVPSHIPGPLPAHLCPNQSMLPGASLAPETASSEPPDHWSSIFSMIQASILNWGW